MNTASKLMYDWKDIPWTEVTQGVYKLQKRIYQASLRGDKRTVRKLQRLLLKSWYGRLLAVRRVTQDNQGKKTPGIDGIVILDPIRKIKLAKTIDLCGKSKSVKRVYIPKPGNQQEKRPLGIPVIRDRAEQAVVKLALEPEWEAKFEAQSYGFRPGRGCHDAIGAIFASIALQPKFVLDADIRKCFDRIDHKYLLEKLNTFPLVRRKIQQWLKAGAMEGDVFYPTDRGTQQGGVISPLLANIALYGLGTEIETAFPKTKKVNGHQHSWRPQVIVYADDFVILHREAATVETAREQAKNWLAGVGLELKPEKTRFTHTLNYLEQEKPGFNFLGFTVRQFPIGKVPKSVMKDDEKPTRFKTLIKPSKTGIERHINKLREIIHIHRSSAQDKLIYALNPVVRGWCNYYSTVVSKKTFDKISCVMFQMLWAWAKRRHPHKSKGWIYNRYWIIHQEKRVFKDKDSPSLLQHPQIPIQRHIKVQGTRSPYDGDWLYWTTRMGRHPNVEKKVAKLLKKQQGKCTVCGLYFTEMDLPEIYKATKKGQKTHCLIHNHCKERSALGGLDAEEPCAGKLASTVLEPS